MMSKNRITNEQIDGVIELLNETLDRPRNPWTRNKGKNKGNVGNFHVYSAYGGYGLHEIVNESGAAKGVIELGSKRVLFEGVHLLLKGIQLVKKK
jgi:hypothetical protein